MTELLLCLTSSQLLRRNYHIFLLENDLIYSFLVFFLWFILFIGLSLNFLIKLYILLTPPWILDVLISFFVYFLDPFLKFRFIRPNLLWLRLDLLLRLLDFDLFLIVNSDLVGSVKRFIMNLHISSLFNWKGNISAPLFRILTFYLLMIIFKNLVKLLIVNWS